MGIAAYHYIRIFNSWVESYKYPAAYNNTIQDPQLTGVPFNDAYRYMDWLLTVPLLLIEIVFVMKLSPEETSTKATQLGVACTRRAIAQVNTIPRICSQKDTQPHTASLVGIGHRCNTLTRRTARHRPQPTQPRCSAR